jgi:predicted metal-dependent phosphoesterase TrpH
MDLTGQIFQKGLLQSLFFGCIIGAIEGSGVLSETFMDEITKTLGLAYRKLDLHIHTPASRCFKDKTVTPETIINKAVQEHLDAIAITDHNTGAWVDKIKEAAGNKLIIFPGVEISSTGGSAGIVHIIGIFENSKTTKDLENLLGDLQIKADKYGTEDAFTTLSPSDVIDKIVAHNGLAILAHANSDKGVMGGMRGNPRTDIIQNANLIAAEATESDFQNEEKKAKGTRVCDCLDGTNLEYRKLAVYQASDNPSKDGSGNHSLDGIGVTLPQS